MPKPQDSSAKNSLAVWEIASEGLLVAVVIITYIPTFVKLAEGPWRTEQAGHGPLIIGAAVWLAWQCREKLKSASLDPAPIAGWAILLTGLVGLILARSQNILFIECLSEIPVIGGCVVLFAGWAVFRIVAFPIGLLIFAAPPPSWMLDTVTLPLKIFVSDFTTQILYSSGYPVAQNGVVIMIGTYQLLVKNACSGLNSIYALTAIGMIYVYLFRSGSKVRASILLLSILPITIAANGVRVMALALATYYGGVNTVTGDLHDLTGIALFIAAIILLVSFDGLLGALSGIFRRSRML